MLYNTLVLMHLLCAPMQLTQVEQIKEEIVLELVKSHLDTDQNGIVSLNEALKLLQEKKTLMDYFDIDLMLTIIAMYLGIDITKKGAIKGLAKLTKKGKDE